MDKVLSISSCTLPVSLSAGLVKITRQLGIQQLQKLDGKGARVVIHLVMALWAIITPACVDMECIQMIHICLDTSKRVRGVIPP